MRRLFPLPDVSKIDEDLTPESDMIVKPSHGGGSRAVFLARKPEERWIAQEFIEGLNLAPVVEQYLEGPEVDMNIALQDGRVKYAELSDNIPSMC